MRQMIFAIVAILSFFFSFQSANARILLQNGSLEILQMRNWTGGKKVYLWIQYASKSKCPFLGRGQFGKRQKISSSGGYLTLVENFSTRKEAQAQLLQLKRLQRWFATTKVDFGLRISRCNLNSLRDLTLLPLKTCRNIISGKGVWKRFKKYKPFCLKEFPQLKRQSACRPTANECRGLSFRAVKNLPKGCLSRAKAMNWCYKKHLHIYQKGR